MQGYRILALGEVLQNGDEFQGFRKHEWFETLKAGRVVGETDDTYRRKITADAPVDSPRKAHPLATGCLDYFPDALMEVALVSKTGSEQHHPGQPLHWDKSKSTDEPDALLRHLKDRGKRDMDGMRHSAKVAWRALALLQREIDNEKA